MDEVRRAAADELKGFRLGLALPFSIVVSWSELPEFCAPSRSSCLPYPLFSAPGPSLLDRTWVSSCSPRGVRAGELSVGLPSLAIIVSSSSRICCGGVRTGDDTPLGGVFALFRLHASSPRVADRTLVPMSPSPSLGQRPALIGMFCVVFKAFSPVYWFIAPTEGESFGSHQFFDITLWLWPSAYAYV
jgi:hypothetical protein